MKGKRKKNLERKNERELEARKRNVILKKERKKERKKKEKKENAKIIL